MSVEARHAILFPLLGLSSEENCFFWGVSAEGFDSYTFFGCVLKQLSYLNLASQVGKELKGKGKSTA
jgi:hypothetical protein